MSGSEIDGWSDIEGRTLDYIDRMVDISIEVDGDTVLINCADERQAEDMADSVALLLADRIQAWRRVAEGIPSREQRLARSLTTLQREEPEDGG